MPRAKPARRRWHRESDYADTGILGYYEGKTRLGRVRYGTDPQAGWLCWLAEVKGQVRAFLYQLAAKQYVEQEASDA